MKFVNSLFIFWLTLLPFVVWNNFYEGPKIIYFLSGGFVLSVFWLIRLIKSPNNLRIDKSDVWFLSWLVVITLASLVGVHPLLSFIGGSYRHQGVIFFLSLWLVAKTIQLLSEKEKLILGKGIAVSILIESLLVLFQFGFGKLYFGKSLGTLGEANSVSGFLAIGSYFLVRFLSQKYLLLLPLTAILFEQSRSATLSILAYFDVFLNKLSKISKFFIWVFVIASGIFSISYFSMSKGVSIFESRPVIWKLGIEKVLQTPMLGYGAESGEVVYNFAYIENKIPLSGLIIDRAHNLFLDVAIWSGLSGLIIFSGWLYLSFKKLDRYKKLAFLAFLIFATLQPLSVVHWVLIVIIFNI